MKYQIGNYLIDKLQDAIENIVLEGKLIKHDNQYTIFDLLNKEKKSLKLLRSH